MMKCKYCGGNLTLEQAYCPHCGRPNEEAAQHVKDMEHYKSNFEDTKSDVYEVAEKNTEIMSHMIIITVLVILCVVVFVVSARSWSIHRGLLQFDAGIRQGSYMKQMEQYLEDEDYIGLSAFCDRHYIRPYSSNNNYEKYQRMGLDVQPTEQLEKVDYDYLIIAVKGEDFANSIKRNLMEKYAIPEYKIKYYEPRYILDSYYDLDSIFNR